MTLAGARRHAEPAADPFDLWVDEFLIGAGQIMGAEIAAQYDQCGEFDHRLALYFGHGWGPGEAAANETIAESDRRTIEDGPHPLNEPDAAEDLKALKPFIKEYQPVLVGVGVGADILRKQGHRPGPPVRPAEPGTWLRLVQADSVSRSRLGVKVIWSMRQGSSAA